MTVWNAAQIWQIVGDARVNWGTGSSVVALALATSGGQDAYHEAVYPGPSQDRIGLWGIDVVAYPELGSWNLYDPVENAKAVHYLAVDKKLGLSWSPEFTSGAFAYFIPEQNIGRPRGYRDLKMDTPPYRNEDPGVVADWTTNRYAGLRTKIDTMAEWTG